MILDAWHALDAEEDLAASGQPQARRPWTEAELAEALATVRCMGSMGPGSGGASVWTKQGTSCGGCLPDRTEVVRNKARHVRRE